MAVAGCDLLVGVVSVRACAVRAGLSDRQEGSPSQLWVLPKLSWSTCVLLAYILTPCYVQGLPLPWVSLGLGAWAWLSWAKVARGRWGSLVSGSPDATYILGRTQAAVCRAWGGGL